MAEQAEAVSAAAEEPEATAVEETKAASATADQEEALAAKLPQWRIRNCSGFRRSLDEELEAAEAHKNRSQNQNNWTRSWNLQRPARTGAKTKATFIFTDVIPLPIFASRGGAVSPSRRGHTESLIPARRNSCLSHPTTSPCLVPRARASVPSAALSHAAALAISSRHRPPSRPWPSRTRSSRPRPSRPHRPVRAHPARGRLGHPVTSVSSRPQPSRPRLTHTPTPRPRPSCPRPSRPRPTRAWPSWPSRSRPSRLRPSRLRAAVPPATVVATSPAWVRAMDNCG